MSSSEESLTDDEDYVPEEAVKSDDDDDSDQDENVETIKQDAVEKDEDKNKIEEMWQSFKNDVAQKDKTSDKPETNGKEEESACVEEETKPSKKSKNTPIQKESDTVTITKVYDFAGEEVKVTKEVKRDSEEAIKHFKEQSGPLPSKGVLGRSAIGGALKKKAGGEIGSVLGRLGKKPKLSTLEKSKLDWKQYKEKEGIEEELQAYNKGKEGYLEKVSFLERTEMRQFERERDMRLKQSAKR